MYYLISMILVVIDQLVKWWVRETIPLGQSVPFIPHVMDLTYTRNTGAAFSFLAGTDLMWLLTLISLGASVAVAILMWRRFFKKPLGMLTLALILAGAVGNLIDRAIFGYVTDMFATTFINFAVFNVADICVTVGGALFVVYILFFDKEAPHDTP